MLSLAARRPQYGQVITTSDHLRIAFRYPAQLMPMLVLFRDLIEPELGALPQVLGPGRLAIDVGASIGTWSLPAASTGASVHACEPDPVNLATLRSNIEANVMTDRIVTHQVALGSEEGYGSLLVTHRRYGNRIASELGTGELPVTTLTQFADTHDIGLVDALKVNTAGGERAVMVGALDLFRAGRIKLAIVLDGLEVRPVLYDLRSDSYDVGLYDGRARRFISVPNPDGLDAKPTPLNRYVLVRRRDVTLDHVPTTCA